MWMFPKIVVPPNIPKSSILIGFSTINHQFWGTSIIGNTHVWCHSSPVYILSHQGSRLGWSAKNLPLLSGSGGAQFCDPVSKFGYLGLEYPFCVETEDTDPQNGFWCVFHNACFWLLNNAESSEKTTLLYWAFGEMCRFWQVNWRHAEEVHMFSGDSNLQARSFHTWSRSHHHMKYVVWRQKTHCDLLSLSFLFAARGSKTMSLDPKASSASTSPSCSSLSSFFRLKSVRQDTQGIVSKW